MNEQKWIPVSERLPEHGHVVDAANNIAQFTRRAFRSNGRWLQDDSDPIHRIELEVTHWKECDPPPPPPLPYDPFNEWWNSKAGCSPAITIEADALYSLVCRGAAKQIWDAAMDSMKGKQ